MKKNYGFSLTGLLFLSLIILLVHFFNVPLLAGTAHCSYSPCNCYCHTSLPDEVCNCIAFNCGCDCVCTDGIVPPDVIMKSCRCVVH